MTGFLLSKYTDRELNTGWAAVGFREKIGKMNDIWRDTILLERRSKKVGIG